MTTWQQRGRKSHTCARTCTEFIDKSCEPHEMGGGGVMRFYPKLTAAQQQKKGRENTNRQKKKTLVCVHWSTRGHDDTDHNDNDQNTITTKALLPHHPSLTSPSRQRRTTRPGTGDWAPWFRDYLDASPFLHTIQRNTHSVPALRGTQTHLVLRELRTVPEKTRLSNTKPYYGIQKQRNQRHK